MRYPIIILSTIVAGLLGFSAASCGAGSGAEAVGPVPSTPAGTSPPEAGSEPTATVGTDESGGEGGVRYQVFFVHGEALTVASREHGPTPRVGSAALEALLEGPSSLERSEGIASVIPDGTRLLGLEIADAIATVDLTSEFESGGGSLSMRMRLAQVVCTLDQFPTVQGVRFELDGRPVDVFSGEGIVLDHPVACTDYEELLPVILVEQPTVGAQVDNPATVSGSANVFEANVTVRILDAAGDEIALTFTTATCGTGCRGDFTVDVPYDVSSEQTGTIVVQDDDAAGTGSPPHEVRIPVTLTPSA